MLKAATDPFLQSTCSNSRSKLAAISLGKPFEKLHSGLNRPIKTISQRVINKKTFLRNLLAKYHRLVTLDSDFAISKVPTVSMLEAITGIPLYVCFEFLNVMVL